MPQLRAVMLESLRLWPTTPLILRETREPTTWRNGTLHKGTSLVIFAPFFHRDDEATCRSAPVCSRTVWLNDQNATQTGPWCLLVERPGFCPGRNVV